MKQPHHNAATYRYRRRFLEPDRDWRRLPGYASVTDSEWQDAKWQRRHSVRTIADLKTVFGRYLPDSLADSIQSDQAVGATMPVLVPPHMLNTMNENDLWSDPVRRYMLPATADREAEWPSHPFARRDSLYESEMWTEEGLIHRYPYKVLVEISTTCAQYCGSCTRMDLVGSNVGSIKKRRFRIHQDDRLAAIITYLTTHKQVRDVVLSGGDIANTPIGLLERFVTDLLGIEHIRDIRFASKTLVAMPQHFLRIDVLKCFERMAKLARTRDVDLCIHTQANHLRSLTVETGQAVRQLLALGIRDVRNQAVLMRGLNDTRDAILDLSFALLDAAKIIPCYVFMFDIIPSSEHWRTTLKAAQQLEVDVMGYLPGFALPRFVCDVPGLGKRLVHQAASYDQTTGVSSWSDRGAPCTVSASGRHAAQFVYYDPISQLPFQGRQYWQELVARMSARKDSVASSVS